jgi:hypothetical protein
MNYSTATRQVGDRPTKADRLLMVLDDRRWHSTRELSRRVGHTFAVAKYKLVHAYGYHIERRHHEAWPGQYQYRLVDEPGD